MELSIEQRRKIAGRARSDESFLKQLKSEPHAAIAEVTGVRLADDMIVSVIEEKGDGAFASVLPRDAALTGDLPDPQRVRDTWDNLLLKTVAMDEAARAKLLADPTDFAREVAKAPIDRLDVYVESPQHTYLVIDGAGSEEDELDDSSLDMVSGGEKACSTAYV